jgi:hypothetical protein
MKVIGFHAFVCLQLLMELADFKPDPEVSQRFRAKVANKYRKLPREKLFARTKQTRVAQPMGSDEEDPDQGEETNTPAAQPDGSK